MKNSFFENFYDRRPKNIKQLGFLGFIHDKLVKYEITRKDVALSLAPKTGTVSILDIGCYEGSLLSEITKVNPKAEIFGVDVCQEAIEKCKNKFSNFSNNFSLQNIDNGLDFKDNEFDLIFMIATMEHVFDPIFAIKEVARVLKPGGEFIIEVPNIVFLPHRIKFFLGIRPRTSWGYGWDGGHLNYFTQKDLKEALEKEGFTCQKITGSGIFLNLRKWWGTLLLPNIIIKVKKQ
jgi:SAM-dependent methyltransferase